MVPIGAQELVHSLKKGETVYSLAREYGVRPSDILDLNNIKDATKLQAGQRLKIPKTSVVPLSTAVAVPEDASIIWVEYQVSKGDTLYGLARKYDTSIKELIVKNGLKEGSPLKLGAKIKVPQTQPIVPYSLAESSPAPLVDPRKTSSKPSSVNLNWPIKALELKYLQGKLSGVLITGRQGEQITCVSPGTVVSAGPYRGFGLVVIVRGDNGYLYVYGGCDTLLVQEGRQVARGSVLGNLGIDSLSNSAQMHFLVYKGDKAIDPAKAPGIL